MEIEESLDESESKRALFSALYKNKYVIVEKRSQFLQKLAKTWSIWFLQQPYFPCPHFSEDLMSKYLEVLPL